MAQKIAIVAQYAMDQYYQNYRGNTDFFELSDFVFHCGAAIAEAYLQQYEMRRQEMRQEAKEEIVSFSHDWLSEQILKVEKQQRETVAVLKQMPLSFPYDKQDTGIQDVFCLDPPGTDLERSNITEVWQQAYYPFTNRIFWWVDQGKIKFYNKGICNVNQIRVLYVPTISDDMLVPDGVIELAVVNTIAKLKQLAQGVVIKKSLDQNDNKTIETEIDRSQFKG
jgi:hypothetical protein